LREKKRTNTVQCTTIELYGMYIYVNEPLILFFLQRSAKSVVYDVEIVVFIWYEKNVYSSVSTAQL